MLLLKKYWRPIYSFTYTFFIVFRRLLWSATTLDTLFYNGTYGLTKAKLIFFVRFVLGTNTNQIKTNYSDLSVCYTSYVMGRKLKKNYSVAIIV